MAASVRRYRLLSGKHSQTSYNEKGEPRNRCFNPGEVIETTEDLLRFNQPGFPPKFQDLDSAEANQALPANAQVWNPDRESWEDFVKRMSTAGKIKSQKPIESLSLKELQDFATAEGIDLRGAKTQAEALKIIKAAIAS